MTEITSMKISMEFLSFLSSASMAAKMRLQKAGLRMSCGSSLMRWLMMFLSSSVTVIMFILSMRSRSCSRSGATLTSCSWSRMLTNSLQRNSLEALGSSLVQERKAQKVRKAHSSGLTGTRLASRSTLLCSSCLLSPFICSYQQPDRLAKQIIFSRLPVFSYISAIRIHTRLVFSTCASPPSRFSSTFSPCRQQLIFFSGLRGSSASCSRISLDVACVQPSDRSQISSDFRNIFSHLEGSWDQSCSQAKLLQTVMVSGWLVPKWQPRQFKDFQQNQTPLFIYFRWLWYFSRIWKGRTESECFSGIAFRASQAQRWASSSCPRLKYTSASYVQKQAQGSGPTASVFSVLSMEWILERILSSLMHSSSLPSLRFSLYFLQTCLISEVSMSQVLAEPCTSRIWAALKMESKFWKKGQSMILRRMPKWQQRAWRMPPPCISGGQEVILQSQQRLISAQMQFLQSASASLLLMKRRLRKSTKQSLNSWMSCPPARPCSPMTSWKVLKKQRLQARATISVSRIFLLKSRFTFSASEPMYRMFMPYSCSRSSMPWLSTRNTVVLSSIFARLEMWSSFTRLHASASYSSPSGSGFSLTQQKTTLERGALELITTSGRRQPTDLMMSLSMKSGQSLATFMRQKLGSGSSMDLFSGKRMESRLISLRKRSCGRYLVILCSSRVRLKGISTDFLSEESIENSFRLRLWPITLSMFMYSSLYWQMVPVGPCTSVSRPSQGLSAWQKAVQPMYLTRQDMGTRILGSAGMSLARLSERLLRMLCDMNSWCSAFSALQSKPIVPFSSLFALTRATRTMMPSSKKMPSSPLPLRLYLWSISSMHLLFSSPVMISRFTISMHFSLNSASRPNSLNQLFVFSAQSESRTYRYSHSLSRVFRLDSSCSLITSLLASLNLDLVSEAQLCECSSADPSSICSECSYKLST